MTKEEEEIFHKSKQDAQEESWERMKWIKEKERTYNIEDVVTWEITKYLYNEGTLSYVNGRYASSILSVSSTIDSFLSSIISAIEFANKTMLSKRIDKAEELGRISPDLAEELSKFNDRIRNYLVHPKGPNTHFFLGGEFDEEAKTWKKDFQLSDIAVVKGNTIIALKFNPIANMRKVCEYSLVLFMRTVRDHLDLKYNHN